MKLTCCSILAALGLFFATQSPAAERGREAAEDAGQDKASPDRAFTNPRNGVLISGDGHSESRIESDLHPRGGDAAAMLHSPNPKHRSPLALWSSFQEMKTWPCRRVPVPESSDGPQGRRNYPDGFVSRDWQ